MNIATDMYQSAYMKFSKVVRYLENRFSIRIDVQSLHLQLQYIRDGEVRRGLEAMMLVELLLKLKSEDPDSMGH